MLISIVGLSGSGKSFIAKKLQEYNEKIIHIDIDNIGHSSHQNPEVKEKLINTFGEKVITNGQIDRKKLSTIVLNSPEAMNELEEITWSFMEEQLDNIIAHNKDKIIIFDWLLLPRTKYFFQSDIRILVTAPLEIRMQRAMSRDKITPEKFLERESAAPQLDESKFEYVINNINLQETQERVNTIYDQSIIHR